MTIVWILVGALLVIWLGIVFVGPPFVPALRRDVEALFSKLSVGKGDCVVDLGAGDGRVLVLAAQRGACVAGVELNPFLVLAARWRLRRLSPEAVTLGDMWRYHLPNDTTHVFAFSAGAYMNKLERYIVSERRHTGALTVMCYGFRFKGREPQKVIGAFNCYRF